MLDACTKNQHPQKLLETPLKIAITAARQLLFSYANVLQSLRHWVSFSESLVTDIDNLWIYDLILPDTRFLSIM